MKSKNWKQLKFEIKTHGGKRKGAGRKKLCAGEPNHVKRAKITGRTPVHVTLKLQSGLPALRHVKFLKHFANSVRGAAQHGLHVNFYSVQHNHIHFIAEASDNSGFAKGMQSLTIRFAKAIRAENSAIAAKRSVTTILQIDSNPPRTSKKIFVGRYHAHVLNSPSEVRRSLAYVLQNTQRHWEKMETAKSPRAMRGNSAKGDNGLRNSKVLILDPFTSLHALNDPVKLFGTCAKSRAAKSYLAAEPWFKNAIGDFLLPPNSWLLRVGWQKSAE